MTATDVMNDGTSKKTILFEYALFSMGYFIFIGTNALYLSKYKAYDATTVGLLLLVSSIASKTARILLAGAIDKISSKLLSLSCAALTAAGYASLGATHVPILTGASLIVIGIGYATNSLLVRTLMAQVNQPGTSTILRFASLSICTNLAAALGPFIGLFVLNKFGGQYHLVMAALVTALVIPLILASEPLPSLTRQAGWKAGIRTQIQDKRLLLSLGLTAVGWFLYSQLYSAMPLYVGNSAKNDWLLGTLFTLNAAIVLLVTLTIHKKLSALKIDLHTSIGFSFALYGVGSMLVWVNDTPNIMIFTVVLWTFGEILLLPALQAYLADNSSPENRVVLFALNALAMGVGEGLGGLVGASLTMNGSAPTTNAFLLCSLLSIALTVAMLVLRKRG